MAVPPAQHATVNENCFAIGPIEGDNCQTLAAIMAMHKSRVWRLNLMPLILSHRNPADEVGGQVELATETDPVRNQLPLPPLGGFFMRNQG